MRTIAITSDADDGMQVAQWMVSDEIADRIALDLGVPAIVMSAGREIVGDLLKLGERVDIDIMGQS